MDNQPDDVSGNTTTSVPDSIAAQPPSVGVALREARTRLGLGVSDVASRIKLAQRQIEALEADDFAHLPEMTFVRGFVRSYARLLQLDPAPLLAALPGALAPLAPSPPDTLAEIPYPDAHVERRPNIIWLAAALAVAAVLALFAWLHSAPNAAKEPHVEALPLPAALPVSAVPEAEIVKASQVAAPAARQVPAPTAKQAAASSVPKRPGAIRLEIDEESWVEVKDSDGKALLSQLIPRGGVQSIEGAPPFSIVIGHAKGVRLYYKEQAVNLAPHTNADVAHLTLE